MSDTPDVMVLQARLEGAEAANHAMKEALREAQAEAHAALKLVTDIRFALGDNGRRMQPELVEWCKEIAAELDAARKSEPDQVNLWRGAAAQLKRERDDWKAKAENLGSHGYDVAREADDLRAQLDSSEARLRAVIEAGKTCVDACDGDLPILPLAVRRGLHVLRAALNDAARASDLPSDPLGISFTGTCKCGPEERRECDACADLPPHPDTLKLHAVTEAGEAMKKDVELIRQINASTDGGPIIMEGRRGMISDVVARIIARYDAARAQAGKEGA